jgi:cob(I)alamin adenosyltransferase
MSLYTGRGDQGTTKLFDSKAGERVSKGDPMFEALGTLDELNSVIGWCKVLCTSELVVAGRPARDMVHEVQDHLFTIQAELAGAPKTIHEWSVRDISIAIHFIQSKLPPITTFSVAGGTELSARFDIARTIARRAERRVVTVHESGVREIGEFTRAYMNRLSSFLFALARFANEEAGVAETAPNYRD